MGSDFAALDAELEALGDEVAEDALALAASYAQPLPNLAEVDRALAELDGERPALQVVGDDDEAAGEERAFPQSEEIILPEPVSREELEAEASREIPLDEPAPRSGSFALPSADASDDDLLVDETIEIEMEDDEAALAAPAFERPRPQDEQSAAPVRPRARQQFDLEAPRGTAEGDADSEFAALFAEATRQSSMPSADDRGGRARLDDSGFSPVDDDTEIFDSSVLGFGDEQPIAEAYARGDRDGAEFQRSEQAAPGHGGTLTSSAPPPRPSQPPEKRPSFLGRLFGRKEDQDGPLS